MRRGEKSLPTIQTVEAEVNKINNSGILPPGVQVEKIYDRTDLINVTTHTVLENMLVWYRTDLPVAMDILGRSPQRPNRGDHDPVCAVLRDYRHDCAGRVRKSVVRGRHRFWLVVDATVIMVENIFRHLGQPNGERPAKDDSLHGTQTILGLRGKFAVIPTRNSGQSCNLLLRCNHHCRLRAVVHKWGASRDTSSAQWRGPMAMQLPEGSLRHSRFHRRSRAFTPQSS